MARPPRRAAREGRDLLSSRLAEVPELLRRAFAAAPPELAERLAGARAVRTTGIGSSAAHARYLAFLLAEHRGLAARFSPTGDFVAGSPAGARDDALVVFSQALSPNARFALERVRDWHALVLVTALGEAEASDEERALLSRVREAGGVVLRMPGGPERGALLRVAGPLCGYAVAIRIARAVRPGISTSERADPVLEAPVDSVVSRVARALDRPGGLGDCELAPPIALLASGSYSELLGNLRLKLLEGLLRPPPAVWDLLDFAHGPFQQAYAREGTLLAFTREGEAREEEVLARLESLLDPARHRLLRIPAALPGELAIFEHEARLNRLVLDRAAAEAIDPIGFPGRGEDAALYGFAPGATARLDELTTPELEARLAGGDSTAVLPLGATEQHGPHLPLATDTWIADALAERFCARVPGAVRLPTLPLGCSREHLDFPGTLSLATATLRALLSDVLASLERHGFGRVFLFSAHGGNAGPLAEVLPGLRDERPDLEILAFTDHAKLTAQLHACSAGFGVDAAAAGHHAGEVETSLATGLWPRHVREDRAVPGLPWDGSDARELFYPSLRPRSPSGVVGDPTRAAPERAEVYLRAWTDLLVESYRRQKNEKKTKGTQKA